MDGWMNGVLGHFYALAKCTEYFVIWDFSILNVLIQADFQV